MAVKTNITINIVEPGSNVPVPDTGLFTHGIGSTEATIIVSAVLVTVLVILSIVLTTYMYRKHKKQGKTTKLVHLVDSTKTVVKSKKRITIGLSIIALLVSACTFTAFMLNTNKSNTSAIEGNDIEQQTGNTNNLTINAESKELTIEVKDQPVFAVLPVEVTVEEATAAGYTITAYTDSTDLVSTTNPDNAIPMIAVEGDELEVLTDNTYGLALEEKPTTKDEAVYTSLSIDPEEPTILKSMPEYTPTEANDTTTIYYGFYITPDTPYGTYKSSDIYYNATTNSSKVIFHGNGLYFNNNPEQTTNDVEYITGITSNTAKYSHTPNINDEGVAESALNYGIQTNEIVTIPGASTLHVVYTYGGGYQYGWPFGYGSFWQGPHSDYTPDNNYSSGIQNCGGGSITDGKYYSDNNTQFTVECDIPGDTATFGYWTSGGGPGSTATSYGYYVTVTGYDADGNIIYLPGNTQVGGEYKDPSQDLPYIFLGWNEDKDATTATYESAKDIALNLSLTEGKTTNLYAVWQHATKISFDGNGNDGGEAMNSRTIVGGSTTTIPYNTYTKDGYQFIGWNTDPNGGGDSYVEGASYTAPTNISQSLTFYAQWEVPTTLYEMVQGLVKMEDGVERTQTLEDMQADITVPTSEDHAQDTSNSGVYKYDANNFGPASDASTDYAIYYYRGVLEQTESQGAYGSDGQATTYPNYVKLSNNTCWRIVRTTGSGGVKMVYNGTWTGSTCANSTTNAQTTKQAFASKGTSSQSSWYRNIHYVGYTFNNSVTDSAVETSVNTVFGSDTNPSLNNTRSNIKTYIEDTWYASNMTAYTNLLEPAAGYCNDRTAYSDDTTLDALTTIKPFNSGKHAYGMYFGAYGRNQNAINAGKTPSLTCPRSTVDLYRYVPNSDGISNELKYPTALLTADEMSFAGFGNIASNIHSFLHSGNSFWLLSPSRRALYGNATGLSLSSDGAFIISDVLVSDNGVRPAISLNHEITVKGGTGTATDPWMINE